MKYFSFKISAAPFVLFTISCILFINFAGFGLDFHHDGFAFKPALDVANGAVIFKETFSQYGPLTVFIQSIIIKVFGEKLLYLKVGSLFFNAVSVFLITLILNRFIPLILLLPTYLLCLVFAYFLESPVFPWSSDYALFFQLLGLFFFVKLIDNPRKGIYAFLAGLCTALVFWCRQPVGVAAFTANLGFIIFISLRSQDIRISRVLFFLLGACLGVGSMISYFINLGILNLWYQQNILWPQYWISVVARREPSFWRLFPARLLAHPITLETGLIYLAKSVGLLVFVSFLLRLRKINDNKWIKWGAYVSVFCLFYYLKPILTFKTIMPAVSTCFGFFVVFRSLKEKYISTDNMAILALTVACAAAWCQYYPFNDGRHVYWGIFPSIFCFSYVIYQVLNKNIILTLVIFLMLWAPSINEKVKRSINYVSASWTEIQEPKILAGMKVPENNSQRQKIELEAIKFGEKLVELEGDRPIINWIDDPLYGCLKGGGPVADPYWSFLGSMGQNEFFGYFLHTRKTFIHKHRPFIFLHPGLQKLEKDLVQGYKYKIAGSFNEGRIKYLVPEESRYFEHKFHKS